MSDSRARAAAREAHRLLNLQIPEEAMRRILAAADAAARPIVIHQGESALAPWGQQNSTQIPDRAGTEAAIRQLKKEQVWLH